MKIVRWLDPQGNEKTGQLLDDGTARPLIGDLLGDHAFAERSVQVGRRIAPVAPVNIIAIGRNYAEHAKEMKSDAPTEEPLIFLKLTTSVIGPDDPIVLPRSAPDEVDFEAELAVVIGRRAKDVTQSHAMSHVLGYTCANDVSARDCQKRRDKQWARGKSFDSFCPLGPVLVTADEFDPSAVNVRSFLNGEPMQSGNTSDLIFSIPFLVSYLSHQFTLAPGTVILTGTPAGVGSARNPPVFLRDGDEIAVDVDGIGRLANTVVTGG